MTKVMDIFSLQFIGLKVYPFGLLTALGALSACLMLLWLTRKDKRINDAAVLSMLLAVPLGLILSRALYCVSDINFRLVASFRNALRLSTGGFSMFGALLGIFLSLLLASSVLRTNRQRMMDLMSPAVMVFILFERLGEQFTMLGISRPLVTGLLNNTFLAFHDTYGVYLKTWLLEAIVAAVLVIVLLHSLGRQKKAGNTFLLWMLLFGSTQTIMESLRYDGHMRFSFIGLQQVLAFTLFAIAVIVCAVRVLKMHVPRALPITTLTALALVLGGVIGLEFLIDRSQINKALLYILYVTMMAIPVFLAIRLRNRSELSGTKQN